MESKLFWISMVSGVYAWVFRSFVKKESRVGNRFYVALINGAFWAFFGASAGALLSTYWERPEIMLRLMVGLAGMGFALGFQWPLTAGMVPSWVMAGVCGMEGFVAGNLINSFLANGLSPFLPAAFGLGGFLSMLMASSVKVPALSLSLHELFWAVQGGAAGYYFTAAGSRPDLAFMGALAGAGAAGAAGFFVRPHRRYDEKEVSDLLREDLEWADTGFSAILLASVIMYFAVQAFKIPSGSMRMTLLEGDHLFVNKFIYGVRIPYTEKRWFRVRPVQRGDVIVFRFPEEEKDPSGYFSRNDVNVDSLRETLKSSQDASAKTFVRDEKNPQKKSTASFPEDVFLRSRPVDDYFLKSLSANSIDKAGDDELFSGLNSLLDVPDLFVKIEADKLNLTPEIMRRWAKIEKELRRGKTPNPKRVRSLNKLLLQGLYPAETWKSRNSQHLDKDFIKRAVGLPGDTVEIRNKKVFINGKPLDEVYTSLADDQIFPPQPVVNFEKYQKRWETGGFSQMREESVRDNFGPVTVPPGHYLAMGDNRDRSFDSRFWGPLPEKYLKGRAWLIYWPLGRRKIIR